MAAARAPPRPTARRPSSPSARGPPRRTRTYVLDTSVLLADPGALGRFDEHEVVLPVVVITELEGKRTTPSWATSPGPRCAALDELRVLHGRLDEPVPVGDAGGTHPGRAQPHRPHVAAVRLPARRQRLADPRGRPQPRPGGRRRSRWSPRTCRCGSRRPRSASTPRSTSPSWPPSPAGPGWPSSRSAAADLDELYDDGVHRPRGGPRPALPHRAGAALRARQRARPGQGRQAGAAGARRPGRLRDPRPLRGAADRARAAARPRGRHRLARRPGRHRQVGDGAVRRASRR